MTNSTFTSDCLKPKQGLDRNWIHFHLKFYFHTCENYGPNYHGVTNSDIPIEFICGQGLSKSLTASDIEYSQPKFQRERMSVTDFELSTTRMAAIKIIYRLFYAWNLNKIRVWARRVSFYYEGIRPGVMLICSELE